MDSGGAAQCAIELGAGTGKATFELARWFREVIAVEPDPLMAEKLREAAPEAKICQIPAEEDEGEQSSADLINFAQSLHWMDIPRVLEKCVGWLRAGGILAAYGFGLPEAVEPVREIVRSNFASTGIRFVTSACAGNISLNASSTSQAAFVWSRTWCFLIRSK
jgi:trans-aconitate methyltransferase